jgi:glucan phosphoethanolaminetransferase (alkaline phosphatase superfamily)
MNYLIALTTAVWAYIELFQAITIIYLMGLIAIYFFLKIRKSIFRKNKKENVHFLMQKS